MSFPENKSQALAMLYLQNQDLSKLSPTELLEEYQKAYDEITDAAKTKASNQARITKRPF